MKKQLTLPPRSGTIIEMAWSPDGNKLAVVTDIGYLHVWYTTTGKHLLHQRLGRTRLLTVAWDRTSLSLAVGAENGVLYRLSRLTADPILSRNQFPAPITQIAWSSSPLGRCLVVCGQTLIILDGRGKATQTACFLIFTVTVNFGDVATCASPSAMSGTIVKSGFSM